MIMAKRGMPRKVQEPGSCVKDYCIEIKTIASGYACTINGEEYLYFNVRKLLMGIAQHTIKNPTHREKSLFADALYCKKSPIKYFTDKIESLEAQLTEVRHQRYDLSKENRSLHKDVLRLEKEAHKEMRECN